MKFNPQSNEILEEGDVLVMLGRIDDLEKINKII
jgi:K+/H+ antiporter YhaU regulatory subunit KhtT